MKKVIKLVEKLLRWILPSALCTILGRLKCSYSYNKDKFLLKNSAESFTDIYKNNYWGSQESASGGGSTMAGTVTIREQLPLLIDKFAIRSMLDVPCGDYNWMKEVPKTCDYIGGDIVAEVVANNRRLYTSDKVRFAQIDITKDTLPKVDLIFCKDCLQHLSYKSVMAALNNFKSSGSKYLLVTSYPLTWRNHDIHNGDYRALNLQKKPFYLPSPILKIREKSKAWNVEIDKTMYLYELADIPVIDIKC
ncbi:glycosyltransferase [Candidatus Symbiothrix dinenymphae]|nr:glycosyltransferase [Candidatus Symbiothrix dinenymphae]